MTAANTSVAFLEPGREQGRHRRPASTVGDMTGQGMDTSVGKALALLEAVAAPGKAGVTELARRIGVPKSTAFRLLSILSTAGLVERRGTDYCLGRRLFELGSLVSELTPQNLRDLALPHLEDLYEVTHETVHLALLDGTDVLYLEKIFGHNTTTSPSRVGGRVPAYCSGLGKAMLAFSSADTVQQVLHKGLSPQTPYTIVLERVFLAELAEIRRRGYAFDREEIRVGLTCIAAPVLNKNGSAIAAVSVTGTTTRFAPHSFVDQVRKAARAISDKASASKAILATAI